MTNLRWRIGAVTALVLWFTFLTAANFVPKEQRLASPLLPDDGLRLGLDLQGGIHWVLGVKLEEAERQEFAFLRENLEVAARDDGFALESVKVEGSRLVVVAADAAAAAKVREWAEDTGELAEQANGGSLEYALTADATAAVRKRGMDQVLEVLRQRITDPLKGIADSVVTRQGEDRVLVQIPGGQVDRASARQLLRVTGFLEFKIVQGQAQSEELLRANHPGGLPAGTEIATERDKETDRVLTVFCCPNRPTSPATISRTPGSASTANSDRP